MIVIFIDFSDFCFDAIWYIGLVVAGNVTASGVICQTRIFELIMDEVDVMIYFQDYSNNFVLLNAFIKECEKMISMDSRRSISASSL